MINQSIGIVQCCDLQQQLQILGIDVTSCQFSAIEINFGFVADNLVAHVSGLDVVDRSDHYITFQLSIYPLQLLERDGSTQVENISVSE